MTEASMKIKLTVTGPAMVWLVDQVQKSDRGFDHVVSQLGIHLVVTEVHAASVAAASTLLTHSATVVLP
jgi:hypothetical protein